MECTNQDTHGKSCFFCACTFYLELFTCTYSFCRHHTQTHTHTHLTALFLGLPGWAGTRNVKPIWILLKQETVRGSGISWAICKSAPRSRQITTPAPHRSPLSTPYQRKISSVPACFYRLVILCQHVRFVLTIFGAIINFCVCMYVMLPSVLWHCWLGGRKGIRPVKNWVVGCWHGYLSGARCRLACGPAGATATHPGSPGKGAVKRVCVYVCGVMQVASDTGKSSEHGRRQDFHVGGRTEESQGHRRRGGEELWGGVLHSVSYLLTS